MSLESRVRTFAEGLRDEGVPSLTAYLDDEGWHLAAPGGSWSDLAAGLRTLAAKCDELAAEQAARTLN